MMKLCHGVSISLPVTFFSPSPNSCFTVGILKEEDLVISLKKTTSEKELPDSDPYDIAVHFDTWPRSLMIIVVHFLCLWKGSLVRTFMVYEQPK